MSAGRGLGLSSRDPSTRVIAVRLPADLVAAVDHACEGQGVTPSELLRGLVSQWAYGQTQLAGPDEGYTAARSMATRLAHALLHRAIESIPDSHDGARAMLEGFYDERAATRRKEPR